MPDNIDPESIDDQFAERLAEVHEAIAAGSEPSTPAEPQDLQPLKEVLQLIERVRCRAEHDPHAAPAVDADRATRPDEDADTRRSHDDLHADSVADRGDYPTTIGRFELRRQLGQGGFGLVYLAYDPELEREVALKVPRIETLVTEQTRERFLREGKAAARLNHPNIAPVYEIARSGPICYIATAYYPGGSLAERIQSEGRFAPSSAAQLVRALADAIQHAHSRGILHRDLKPGNVMLDERGTPLRGVRDEHEHERELLDVRSPERGQQLSPQGLRCHTLLAEVARITDFGLAKLTDEPSDQTHTGALLGTPAYMSPEQADSRLDEISTVSDVYALGAILYELLTGQPPLMKGSLLATLEAVRRDEPTPPRRLPPELPRDLEAICLKCLEKSPQDRYASCSELAADLDRWLNGRPVTARSITPLERTLRWCRRNPLQMATIVVLVLGLLSATVVSSIAYLQVSRANAALKLSRDAEARRLSQLRESLDRQLSVVLEDLLTREQRLTPAHRKYLQEAVGSYQQFAEDEGNDRQSREAVARALHRVGEINVRLGELDAAVDAYQQSIQRYNDLAKDFENEAALRFERVEVEYALSSLLKDLGRLEEAEAVNRRFTQTVEELLADTPDNPDYRARLAVGLGGLGGIHNRASKLSDAERALGQAVDLLEELVAEFPLEDEYQDRLSTACQNLAMVMFRQRRVNDAVPLARRGLELQRQLHARKPDRLAYREALANQLNGYGIVMDMTQQREKAEQAFRELLAVRRSLADDYPANSSHQAQLAQAYGNLGVFLKRGGDDDEAEQYWHSSVSVGRRLVREFPEVSDHHAQLAAPLLHLAQMELEQKEVETALDLANEGRAHLDLALQASDRRPQLHRLLVENDVLLAKAWSELGRHADAAKAARALLQAQFRSPNSSFIAAGVLARCAVQVQEDEGLAAEERKTLAAAHADRAAEALKLSIDEGFSDASRIATHPALKALVDSRPDLQEMLDTLQARASSPPKS